MADYLPVSESDLRTWFANFKTKVTAAALEALGFATAEATALETQITADYNFIDKAVSSNEQLRNDMNGFVQWKNEVIRGGDDNITPAAQTFQGTANLPSATKRGILERTRKLIARIKVAPLYTEAMGEDLGIVATSDEIPGIGETPPNLTGTPGANSSVSLKFNKGQSNGVQIETKRASEANYSVLGSYFKSPVTDGRAPLVAGQPEIRYYRARYLDGNDPLGAYSDIVSVVTIP